MVLPGARGHTCKQALDDGEVDRLHEVMVETRLLGSAPVLGLAPARERDQLHLLAPSLPALRSL